MSQWSQIRNKSQINNYPEEINLKEALKRNSIKTSREVEIVVASEEKIEESSEVEIAV
jgi:hypothetical protein